MTISIDIVRTGADEHVLTAFCSDGTALMSLTGAGIGAGVGGERLERIATMETSLQDSDDYVLDRTWCRTESHRVERELTALLQAEEHELDD